MTTENGISWEQVFDVFRKIREKSKEQKSKLQKGKWKEWEKGYRWNMWFQTFNDRLLLHLLAKLRGMTEAKYVKRLIRKDFEGLTEMERLRLAELEERFFEDTEDDV